MHPDGHILCIHLPQWPITRFCRRHPECRDGPVAVVHTVGRHRRVGDVSDRAGCFGVRDGMSAAEARALCRRLVCVEHDRAGDDRALDALGRWMTRFTPAVARGWDGAAAAADPPASLFLDLTGCERLFGGIAAIALRVRRALDRFGVRARIAVAPTPGAAWALASAGGAPDQIVDAPALRDAVAPLPVSALRLDPAAVDALRRVGIRRLGDLLPVPRHLLPARFGPSLLTRLDQLTGERAEPLAGLAYDPPVAARAEFDAPVESLESIWLVFEKLLGLVLSDLARRGRGARELRMTCHPERGWGRPTVARTIALSRPHRDRRTLLDLIRCEAGRIDCERGFVRFRLDVPLHEPVPDAQAQLFDPRSADERIELEQLFQRLRVRLGEAAVIRPELVESHLPERAWRPAARGDGSAGPAPAAPAALPCRPLTLFATPAEVRVVSEPSDDRTGRPRQFAWRGNAHRLAHVVGPERVAGEWWRGHNRTRDYYDVEDDAGRRFWLFRVLHAREDGAVVARWFLHGRFD